MKFFIPLLLSLLILSCDDDKKPNAIACDSASTIDEVEWLLALKHSMTNCPCAISIFEGTYYTQTVFFMVSSDPLCLTIAAPTILYNCEGVAVRTFTTSEADQKDFADNVIRGDELYRCKD